MEQRFIEQNESKKSKKKRLKKVIVFTFLKSYFLEISNAHYTTHKFNNSSKL